MTVKRRAFAVALALAALVTAGASASAAEDDWSTLPRYVPQAQVSGTIRNFGFGLGGVLKKWESAFTALQPGIRFDDKLPTSDAAIPALVTGVTDLAPDGGEPIITESLSFYETFGYDLTSVTVASGAYDTEGHSNGIIVYVNAANPVEKLTLLGRKRVGGARRTPVQLALGIFTFFVFFVVVVQSIVGAAQKVYGGVVLRRHLPSTKRCAVLFESVGEGCGR